MTAIGINAASAQMLAGSFVSVTQSQVSISGNSDFSSVLAKRMNNAAAAAGEIRTYTDIKPQKTEYNRSAAKQSTDKATATEPSDQTQLQKTVENANPKEDKANSPQNESRSVDLASELTDDVSNVDNEIASEDFLQGMETLATLLQDVAQLLQITVDELVGKLEEIQLNPAEVFSDGGLQKLIIGIKGLNDNSDFLVNTDALELLNNLKELVDETFNELGIDPEEFAETGKGRIFSELILATETGDTEVNDSTAFSRKISEMMQKNENDSVNADAKDDEPVVEVVHIDSSKESENGSENNTSKDSRGQSSTQTLRSSLREEKSSPVQVENGAEQFVKGLENAMKSFGIDTQVAEGVTVRDVVFQLTDAIKVNITPENTSLEMHLSPENLGRVSLNIQSKDGVMTAQITTENQAAREAIESQLQILKETIESQGIKVEAIEVTISNFSFLDGKNAEREEDNPSGHSGRGRHIGIGSDEETDESVIAAENARLEREVMEQNGSTVNYTA